jgi:carbon monoxide dehydrogenase subunit G
VLENPVVVSVWATIKAPREAIWPYLVDWENLGRWMAEARDFKVTSNQREGVGVTAEATVTIAGIRTKDRVRITRWEPPEVLEIQHVGWVSGSGLIRCVRSTSGTLVEWTEILHPPWGFIGALGLRMVKPVMHRIFDRDLGLLKQIVESESAAWPVQ